MDVIGVTLNGWKCGESFVAKSSTLTTPNSQILIDRYLRFRFVTKSPLFNWMELSTLVRSDRFVTTPPKLATNFVVFFPLFCMKFQLLESFDTSVNWFVYGVEIYNNYPNGLQRLPKQIECRECFICGCFFFSLALFGCMLYVTSDFKRFAYRQIYLLHTQFVFGLGRFKIVENFVLLHDQLRAELQFDWRIGNTILGALWFYVLSSAPQRLFNRLLSIKFILLLPSNVLVATLDQLSFASKLPVFYYNFNLPLTAKNRP